MAALSTTLRDEALVGMQMPARLAWGKHYCRTLAGMLRAERRSNFRDACLQHFGRDASGREALFDTLSSTYHCPYPCAYPYPPPDPYPYP